MPRPNKYDPDKFGKLDGLLPTNVSGRIKPKDDMLPKEVDIAGLPDGEWVSRGVYKMERVIPYGRRYGYGTLENPELSANILEPWGAGNASVYLDLETTGLCGGTGTYAFLVGLGFCEPDSFRVVNLFLAGPAWERNWLAAIEAELPDDFGLVTYNGRAFDLPLLQIRYTLARSVPSWNTNPHLDLLLLVRHFYRGRIASCSLSEIEPRVLGVHRSGEDVPGYEIPGLYTEYLRTSDASPLSGVFYHNTLDIISLSVLQQHIAGLANMEGLCGEDMIRCGDLWNLQGNKNKAEIAWRRALDFRGTEHLANARLAEKAKERGEYAVAKEYFEMALQTDRQPLRNLENLAKIEEHRFGDYEAALAHSEQALKWLESLRSARDYKWNLDRHNILYRINRLKRKLGHGETALNDD